MTHKVFYEGVLDICKQRDKYSSPEELAKEVSIRAVLSLYPPHVARVYDLLTNEYQSTGAIAKKLGIISSYVSGWLYRLYSESDLIEFTRDGKLKSWRKI